MPNDLPASEAAQDRSVETVRDHLLRFLRLLAKDVVRRLADARAGSDTQEQEADVALAEFLTEELVSDRPMLLPASQPRRLLEPTRGPTSHAPETPDGQRSDSD